MTRLPRGETTHSLAVAWFALSCLAADLTRNYRRSTT